MNTIKVINNQTKKRYEITLGSHVAYLEYIPAGQNLVISHTEVPTGLEGGGIGSRLVKHVLEELKGSNKKAIITCPFAIGYIQRHPEYREVIFGYPSNNK